MEPKEIEIKIQRTADNGYMATCPKCGTIVVLSRVEARNKKKKELFEFFDEAGREHLEKIHKVKVVGVTGATDGTELTTDQ